MTLELIVNTEKETEACTKAESSEIWKTHFYTRCLNCDECSALRIIGMYIYPTGNKEEVVNEEMNKCTKYGYESRYHRCNWKETSLEKWDKKEKIWKRIRRY